MIAFTLRIGERLYYRTMQNGEKCTIGGHRKDSIQIDGWEKRQIELQTSAGKLAVQTKPPLIYSNQDCPVEQILTLDTARNCQLMFTNHSDRESGSLTLPYRGIIRFGRSERSDVAMAVPFVSKAHFLLRLDAGTVRIEDNDSTHGLYLNGRRIRAGIMRAGDVLQIWTVRIILDNGKLYFENLDGRLRLGKVQSDTEKIHPSAVPADQQGAFLSYHRSPRMQEQLPREPIVLSDPPKKTAAYERKRSMLAYLLGPSVMLVANLATMGAASPALLLARSAGLVTPLVSVASYSGMDKKQKKRIEEYEKLCRERFGAYIEDQKRHIDEVAQHQREIITRENPSPYECMKTVSEVRRSLWERMPADRDYLDVRLGMGYEPLCVPVKSRAEVSGFRMEDDEMEQVVRQIIEETRIVDHIPARLSLRNYQTVGIVGKRRHAIRLVQSMLAELTCQQSPQNVRLVGFFDKDEMGIWAPLRWFPHIWDDEGQFRYIAFDKKRAHTVCELLSETLQRRNKASSESHSKNNSVPQPYYIVILGSKSLIKKEPIMNLLTKNDPALGVSTIFLFDDLYSLPQDCRYIVEVDNDPCAYDRLDISRKFFFTPDNPPDEDQLDKFAREMSAIRIEELSQVAGIPESITFLQGYGVKHPEQLQIMKRWRDSRPYETLAAPIGVSSGGKVFQLDIQDGQHGPHGLVAGTTGAGKSELLQSWILSMAVNYHPHDVIFVLIDYKGGGMANLLEPLPHVVGKITNLGSGIERALIALSAENIRRQEMLNRYGVNDIKKYQKLYREGRADEPMPYLVIVADEFAELKHEQDAFMSQLISISRTGRSLGIRLVLATQQPGTVVDRQIETNSRFRVCLKMNSTEDSKLVLSHADAAQITHRGRAYARVGEDEIFELFQSYWSGADYRGEEMPRRDEGNRVRIVNATGERIVVNRPQKKRDADCSDELTVIVRHICQTAASAGLEPLRSLWLPELPERFPLQDILPQSAFDGTSWGKPARFLAFPIGRYDDPASQSQGIQYLDLAGGGHCAIYGSSMTGKTTLLKTFLLSMAMCCSPSEAQAYIIDFGHVLGDFEKLPHVGGVVFSAEEEKREKLQEMLINELDRRKKLFSQNAVSTLAAYRSAVGDDLPAIVLVIDNIIALLESFDNQNKTEKVKKFLEKIAGQGASYGLYLMYTAPVPLGISQSIVQNVKNVIALQLNDTGHYSTLVGGKKFLPNIPGRALCRGNPPLEFQVALYLDYPSEPEQNEALSALAKEMNHCWTGVKPHRIPVMSETVSLSDMAYTESAKLPVGQDLQTLETAYVDLTQPHYHLVVCGPQQSANSRYMGKLCRILSTMEGNQLYIIDSPSMPLAEFKSHSVQYCACNDENRLQQLAEALRTELNQRLDAQDAGQASAWPQICLVVDDLLAFIHCITGDQYNVMLKICENAGDLNVIVLASAAENDLIKYSRDTLISALLSSQNGIVIGGNATAYTCFEVDNKTELLGKLGPNDAYLFTAKTCRMIRRVE